uniref:Secreted protein n=1 Tax=Glossina palpalis gambiensis TaxID=67801 RepID=A0A1B0B2S2_9MUSC
MQVQLLLLLRRLVLFQLNRKILSLIFIFERKETFYGYMPDYGHEMNTDLCLCANNCLLKLQNLKISTVENVTSLMRFIAQVTCSTIMGMFATQATNKKSVTKTFQRQRKNQCLLVCRTFGLSERRCTHEGVFITKRSRSKAWPCSLTYCKMSFTLYCTRYHGMY